MLLAIVRSPLLCGLILLGAFALPAAAGTLSNQAVELFEKRCWQCHGGSVAMSDLRLTSLEEALEGGARGPAVTPGKPGESLLYQAVRYAGELKMPPTGQLDEGEVELLAKWIEAGAPWPERLSKQGASSEWWAFQQPVQPAVPQAAGAVNPIDAFAAAKLQEQGLQPAPQADRRTLLRRATFDLHGLPPRPEEIRAFVEDDSPLAWNRVIDRLLASPRYGEKWGRHWLDLVRYGDTAGFETDPYHLEAWRYRDYVIQSFNEDKPYGRFVQEQLAGDELWPDDPEAGTATGFFRVGPHRDLQVKVEQQNRVEKLADYVATTSSVFLGLTVACARCHDHKFDPIPQRDYYRMQAIFEPAENRRIPLDPLALLDEVRRNKREFKLRQIGEQLRKLFAPYEAKLRSEKLAALPAEAARAFRTGPDRRSPQQQALVTEYGSRVAVSDAEVRAALSQAGAERLEAIERRLVKLFKGHRPPPFTDGIGDASPAAPPSFVWVRGNPDNPGQRVQPGFLSVLGGGGIPEPGPRAESTGRRAALAKWITSPENPLTARVMVNRIWQYHFGQGLVDTPSDFGTRSKPPSHPKLLDWLAVEFVKRGWSIKAMHRLIMTSETYRRSSQTPEAAREKDPRNRYLSHANRRRLRSGEIRDAVLAAAGTLNLKMGGIPVVPPLTGEELYGIIGDVEDAWVVTPDAAEHTRRSVYLLSRRTFTQPMFKVFDHPDGLASCSRRTSSTTATQSLTLLNSRFMIEQARKLAARVDTLDQAWRRVLGRTPSEQERLWAEEFLRKQTSRLESREAAFAELARALMNLNEFLYVD